MLFRRRPTGAGIHLQVPPLDLWTTHLFYFFGSLPTDRLACSERYRGRGQIIDFTVVAAYRLRGRC